MVPIKTISLILGTTIAVIAGILFALNQGNNSINKPINPTAISGILLGVRSGNNTQDPVNPHIRQKDSYSVGEPLMLRVTTTSAITGIYTLSARLLTTNRTVVPLNPEQIMLKPGTSTFCCWTVDTAGKYTFQLFRPEGIVAGIPLVITKDNNGKQPPKILQ